MAAVTPTYSGDTTITTPYWYDNDRDTGAVRLTITSVSYEDTTNVLSLGWKVELVSSTSGHPYCGGVAGWVDGTQVVFYPTSGSWYCQSWGSNPKQVATGTYTKTVDRNTTVNIALAAKGMFQYGYTDARWNGTDYPVNASGTLTVTTPPWGTYVKVNGIWTNASPYVKVNGSWVKAIPYIKVNGVWTESK